MARMTLAEYINQHFNGNVAAAARNAGVCREKMRLWATKGIIPRAEAIDHLRKWSGGQVDPNSFYQPPKELTKINACEPRQAEEVKAFSIGNRASSVASHLREMQHA